MRDFFLICCNFADLLKELSDSEKGRLFTACMEYVENGKLTELRGNERFVFSGIKASIDREMEAVENENFPVEVANFPVENEKIPVENENLLVENGKISVENEKICSFDAHHSSLPSSPPTPPLLPISRLTPKEKPPKGGKKKVPHTDAEFEQFWASYPRKVGKKLARKAFDKAEVDIDTLLDAIEQHKKSDQWRKDNGQFIPHPATWLNNARWEDELNLTDTTRPNRPRSYRVEVVDGEEVVYFDR